MEQVVEDADGEFAVDEDAANGGMILGVSSQSINTLPILLNHMSRMFVFLFDLVLH